MVKICRFRPPKQENYGHYRARILSVPLGSFAQPRRSQLKKPGWLTLQTERFRKTLCRNYGAIAHKILEHPMCALSLLMREAELQTSLGNMDSNSCQMATRACTWNPADGEEMSEHLSELFETSSKSKSNILTNSAPRNRAPKNPTKTNIKFNIAHQSHRGGWLVRLYQPFHQSATNLTKAKIVVRQKPITVQQRK